MNAKIKKPWVQFVAVLSAAVCAATSVFVGTGVGKNYLALAAEGDATVDTTEYAAAEVSGPDVNGNFLFTFPSDAAMGSTLKITLDSEANGANGCVGFSSSDDSDIWYWLQYKWDISSIGENTVEVDLSAPETVSLSEGGDRVTDETVISTLTKKIMENKGMSGQFQVWWAASEDTSDITLQEIYVGEKPAETTTTTTTTTTASGDETTTTTATTTVSGDDTTTTTTTASVEDTTTTTTTASVEDTTTTTTTTTSKAETTTTTTTTTIAATTTTTVPTTSVTLETAIDFTQEKDEEGNAYVEFDPKGADQVRFVFKVSSTGDAIATVSYGAWSDTLSKYFDHQAEVDIPTNKIVSYTADVPSEVETTMKASVYYPKAKYVTIQQVVLIYDEAPVTTTTTPFESDLTFTEVEVDADNQVDMIEKCYVNVTLKGIPGYTVTGGIYAGDVAEEWKRTIGEDQTATVGYEIRGEYECNFKVFYYGLGTTEYDVIDMNVTTYYTGDASLNGKVNGSDVLATVRYITSAASDKNEAQDVVCDYDDDGNVSMTDAISLAKAIMGSAKTANLTA